MNANGSKKIRFILRLSAVEDKNRFCVYPQLKTKIADERKTE